MIYQVLEQWRKSFICQKKELPSIVQVCEKFVAEIGSIVQKNLQAIIANTPLLEMKTVIS